MPRILCITDEHPWPATTGYRMRVAEAIRALAAIGEVDVVAAVHPGNRVGPRPPGVDVATSTVVEIADASRHPGLLWHTAIERTPRRVQWRDWAPLRAATASSAGTRYDLAWFSHADAFLGLAPPVVGHRRPRAAIAAARRIAGAVVVDLDNLEDRTLGGLRRARRADATRGVRSAAVYALDGIDERRWWRVESEVLRLADATVVCSELDRSRLGAAATVIPNGYAFDGVPASSPPPGQVLVMVGLFSYPPNRDGARWFVEEVLPRVRAEEPGVELRLVGRDDGALAAVAATPGVSVVGEVDDVGSELAKARATIVPLRSGSGTRIKVIEGFARGVPVVSTSLGAEGIDAVAGRDLLVADTPEDLARECLSVLRDDALWRRLSAAGRARFEGAYRWSDIRPRIAALAEGLVARPARDTIR